MADTEEKEVNTEESDSKGSCNSICTSHTKKDTESNWTKALIFANFILVLITGYYAYETSKLVKVASKQLTISIQPAIHILPYGNISGNNGVFKILLENTSPIKISDFRLYIYCYRWVIPDNKNDKFIPIRFPENPDKYVELIEIEQNIPMEINLSNTLKPFVGVPTTSYFEYKDVPQQIIVEFRLHYNREIDGKNFTESFKYAVFGLSSLDSAVLISKDFLALKDLKTLLHRSPRNNN